LEVAAFSAKRAAVVTSTHVNTIISAAILGYVVYDNSYKMGAAFCVGTIVGLRLTGGFTHAPCFSWAAILTWEISRMVAIECC
jgi:hypothetical protein